MAYQLGTLVEWNDARGFGFIAPLDAPGQRVFLHIGQYRTMGRRPEVGEVLRYLPQQAQDGRWRATRAARPVSENHLRMRRAHQHQAHQRALSTWLPPPLALVWLGVVGCALWRHWLPGIAGWLLLALALCTLLAYGADKHAAVRQLRRIPELHLHALELAGGWPAAVLAQAWLRHKSFKPTYRVTFLVMVLLNCTAMAGLLLWLRSTA